MLNLGKQEDGSELVRLKPSLNCKNNEHFFYRIGSQEAWCNKCPVGYPLSFGTEIREGHIYINDEFVI